MSTGQTSRRNFLIGSAGFAGLTLPALLRAEAATGRGASRKSVIQVHLDGGPPQLDTIDLKPLAPSEIRGEFQPIETTVPELRLCEFMPRLARLADRGTWIRSLVGSAGAHDAFQCQSGFAAKDLQSLGGRPALGSVVSKLQGSTADATPPFVDLMQGRPLVRNSARPGFLGPAHQPFRPDLSQVFPRELEAGMKGELARLGSERQISLTLHAELTTERLNDRRGLLDALDGLRREIDGTGMMSAMDRFTEQAASILTSGELARALDFSREDPRTLDRYFLADTTAELRNTTSESPGATRKFLLARRLIEAGVRCVSLSLSDFDTHSNNFPRLRNLLPILDVGLAGLLQDLEERGLLKDTLIVVWGEFGRTPRIDPKTGGRHHWPQVGPAILMGGDFRHGQMIGATDSTASVVRERPVSYQDVFATVYSHLGIDPQQATVTDPQGRPQHLIAGGQVLRELL
ncbi:MAG: DUF1501 domain-containing protein [Planctomycetaceae bacterium]|nr:DUF1501 domain-containing protein [Planctomycetaceae bacterium]